ncbi:GNAT family N-acetyltransferase [Streptomyces pilosus]|uniref:GNAT family N-acetyltransferase n=1 Tax=Streptomyces pilosus TaxID=28893 RepID=UPI003625717E
MSLTRSLVLSDVAPGDRRMTTHVRPLMRTLRPALTEEDFDRFVTEAHAQGLVLTAAYDAGGHCTALATHRVLATSRGRILFVDDLVTHPGHRSTGIATALLAHLTERARVCGCHRVELDSGTANVTAHRFYHVRGLTIAALHFTLPVGVGT